MLLLSVPVVLLFSGAAIVMSDVLQWLLTLMPMTQGQYETFRRLMSGGVVSLLLACVLAPVVEELLCRGFFLRSFLRQYSPVQAIVFSSAVFAVFHMNIFQALVGFAIGAALGWIAVRAQSLWPCVLGHATYNFACYGLSAGVFESERVAGAAGGIPLFVHLLAFLFVGIGGYMLWKLLGGSVAAGRQAE
jgi:membrane protease YdiL (CAAX protease family)